jgi:hypothetical protein
MGQVTFKPPQIRAVAAATSPPNTLGGGTLCDWYNADAITGLAHGATVGGAVIDSSGNGHTYNTAVLTSSFQVGTGYMGRNCVFGGGFYNTTGSAPVPTGDATYFGIIKTSSAVNQGILGSVGNNGGAYLRLGAFKLNFFANHVGGGGGASTIVFSSGVWTPFLMTYTQSSGSTFWRVGASSETVAGTAGTTFTSPGTTRALGLERWGTTSSDVFSGGWTEIGRYSSVLSEGDLTALWTYLGGP